VVRCGVVLIYVQCISRRHSIQRHNGRAIYIELQYFIFSISQRISYGYVKSMRYECRMRDVAALSHRMHNLPQALLCRKSSSASLFQPAGRDHRDHGDMHH